MSATNADLSHVHLDIADDRMRATVDLPAAPERVFAALASPEITSWWVRPGVFDTRTWSGDVRTGGHWSASGVGARGPYALEGEFTEVLPPRRLVHSWRNAPDAPETTVRYSVQAQPHGARLVIEHGGFTAREQCQQTAYGWQTSLERLAQILSGASA